ncbi:MAG: UDP-N-acetylmuramoyl-L-alanyl-D-glutamate--2,6-diaminopimelate ligase [Clostridia bacterium]|nr:UDP-N-acetylmuramoyl-L-alanyl-D-glutamate--2,6-diaminopimelate ligase [Clostridia bacterium]
MKLCDLVRGLDYTCPRALPDADVTYICHDSRKAGPDALFICIAGYVSDGHNYALSAYDKGVRTFVAQRPIELPRDATVIYVPDTRIALAKLAAAIFDRPADKLCIIGITGTKGKTTTALMIHGVLEKLGIPSAYIGTNGIDFGGRHYATANSTPESLDLHEYMAQMVEFGIRYVVMEVSSQALKLHRVHGIKFDYCIFTNLSPDHIGGVEHADMEEYKACKRLLFSFPGIRNILVNADDPEAAYMTADTTAPVTSFGMGKGCDWRAAKIRPEICFRVPGTSFVCSTPDGQALPVSIPFPGDYSVYNALCALAVCNKLGIPLADSTAALAVVRVKGRFEPVFLASRPDTTFIIDYAHNGASLRAVLESLRAYKPRRLICLFGSVGDRTQMRRGELGAVASELCDLSILTSDNPGNEDPNKIIADIAAAFTHDRYVCIPDRAEAIAYAVKNARKGDAVVLAGKGHENYQLICGKHLPFSEREILLQTDKML